MALKDGKVDLKKKDDGSVLSMPLEKLNLADQEYARAKAVPVSTSGMDAVSSPAAHDSVIRDFSGEFFSTKEFPGTDMTKPSYISIIGLAGDLPIEEAKTELEDKIWEMAVRNRDKIVAKNTCKRVFTVVARAKDKPVILVRVYPKKGVLLTGCIQNRICFTPGEATRFADIEKQAGPALERQKWPEELSKEIALEGLVYWWGKIGLAADREGNISHVLFRELP